MVDASTGGHDSFVQDGTSVDGPPLPSGPVNVVITADNAYSFGYGDVNSIEHFTQGTRSDGDAIFKCPLGNGPEAYVVPEADAPPSAFLYIVAWDDLSVTQGVIADITRQNATVLTGDPGFEVCATGDISYQQSINGPTQAVINQAITDCNAGTGDAMLSSAGWVNIQGPTSTPGANGKLVVGEANDDAGGDFPIVCQPTATDLGVRSTANWMWYDPNDSQSATQDPFRATGTNRYKSYLIFRLGVAAIIE